MSAVGKVIRGRSRAVRCDGCGRISSDRESGYYVDASGKGGNITSKGRDCGHDFCDQCEENNPDPPACPKCAATTCGKCKRPRKTLHDYNNEQWCGTCISRYERRVNTQEMYGRGRRGY